MNETLTHLSQVIPVLAVLAAVFGFLGWSLRGAGNKPAPTKAAKPAPTSDKGQQDRAKNLEAALEKSKAAHKALKAELENLQASSVSKATLETATADLDAARKALESETKRTSTLEADLKKSQETLKTLNARANDGEKAQKDRSFALENELSKTREQLAILQNRPDDSAVLNAEIERLRESVAVSTRFAGEMRKREAAAVEALEKAEAKVADLSDPSRSAPISKKIGPVVDSGRIAAAKAEVIRLVEQNKQKQAIAPVEAAPVIVEEAPVIAVAAAAVAVAAPAIVEESPAIAVAAPAIVEEAPIIVEEAPAVLEETPAVIEEAEAIVEEVPAIMEEAPALPDETPAPKETTPDTKKLPVSGELFALD
ncbi:MAG: hypothetical protein V4819_09155 [Verrucomicrobiota bacterium]